MLDHIVLRGAKTHNLKSIDLTLPRNQLVVITGLSGSGKSSLAFDTLYAEGQRRYVESLSSYARQFLSVMEKPDVEHIEGLSPAIAIQQKSTSHNPRSTVGTVTEIQDYLRLLFARAGQPICPTHKVPLDAKTVSQMTDEILTWPLGTKVMLLAPVVRQQKGEHEAIIKKLKAMGFIRIRINGQIFEIEGLKKTNPNQKATIEAVVDRLKVRADISTRIAESLETCLSLSGGLAYAINMEDENDQRIFSEHFACNSCGYALAELEPRLFSFNNPAGACPDCDGMGEKTVFDENRLITDPERTLAEGAIRDWHRNNPFQYQTLQTLAQHFDFNLQTPFIDLDPSIKRLLFHGNANKAIPFTYSDEKGNHSTRTYAFEGIIPSLTRRLEAQEGGQEQLKQYMVKIPCPSCGGSRLNECARHVKLANLTLPEVNSLSIINAKDTLNQLPLNGHKKLIAEKIITEICSRLNFLIDVGLGYLSLSRPANTLSGGESQRIRLASQIGAGLVGVMYVLDEPSIGLHPSDNARLIRSLEQLRDLGNSLIVVEHDEETIRKADYIVDIGPGAGIHGGEVTAKGTLEQLLKSPNSLTADYLSGRLRIKTPRYRKSINKEEIITLKGVRGNNLKNIDVSVPVGLITCVTGVSGSGKSTLINKTLYPLAAQHINNNRSLVAADHENATGFEHFNKVVNIDQNPIGRTPRSNPATYTGLLTPIRELLANTQEARSRGYGAGRFSFNVKGGRCEACQGDGLIKVEMHFLPDMYVHCDVCKGTRYNRETLEVRFKGKNINEILEMTLEEATDFFEAVPQLHRKLTTLARVGLGYLKLGQSATTLSGGEAQRIKLAKELSKSDSGQSLYILDEPTTGLHFHDISMLVDMLFELRERGNTVVLIEHNLDVIKISDWIIDLGPTGGELGGFLIAEGTPEHLTTCKDSVTGIFLANAL